MAECLLRQTNAAKCKLYYPNILAKFPNPGILCSYPLGEIEQILKPLGLQSQRASALFAIAKTIEDQYSGVIPSNYNSLLTLPHVGQYIAGAVSIFAFGQRVPLLDINVQRVVGRYFGLLDKTTGQKKDRNCMKKSVFHLHLYITNSFA